MAKAGDKDGKMIGEGVKRDVNEGGREKIRKGG